MHAKTMPELILASTSPRRRKLLGELERPFRVIPPTADETISQGATPQQAAMELAQRKGRSVAVALETGLVLAADTLVSVGGEIIGKPRDRSDAVAILRKLARQTQEVITGVCLIDVESGLELTASDTTAVTMRPMTEAEILAYVDSGEAMGKAGAYAIQETGDRFVRSVDGSMSNVVGLPLELVRRMLGQMENERAQEPENP